ncbi:hypothetical protein [Pseudomonas aestiva]|uniref:hypothetical protein n=1 Tax=Pseudomonas aestiva TaxID=3136739 RepID=UPI00326547B1
MTIDWSKAPEGATHWDSRGNACSLGFMKPGLRTGEWEYAGCGGHWVLYGRADMNLINAMIPRPAPWSGEGLPPVGIVCEVKSGHGEFPTFVLCEVIAHFDGETKPCAAYVYTQHDGTRLVGQGTEQAFRPAPTPEQIAAEKREQEISELANDFYIVGFRSYRITAEDLHRLGYRKTEGGAA